MDFSDEITFITSRSSGPGGQHANKTETRVTLKFDVHASTKLSDQQKERIKHKLNHLINNEGILTISCQTTRSQKRNKDICITRFYDRIQKALGEPKKRKRTKPTKASRIKRIENKRKHSEKKNRRQPPKL